MTDDLIVTGTVRMISKDPAHPYGFITTSDPETGEPLDVYIPASYLASLRVGSRVTGRLEQIRDGRWRILEVVKAESPSGVTK